MYRRVKSWGVVGESGCGKSTLATAIMRLLAPPQVLQSGAMMLRLLDGSRHDLLELPDNELRQLRWRHLSYIPQGSMNSLNPVLRVQRQMTDTLLQHGLSEKEALDRSVAALALVKFGAQDSGQLSARTEWRNAAAGDHRGGGEHASRADCRR